MPGSRLPLDWNGIITRTVLLVVVVLVCVQVEQDGRFWCEGDQKYVEQAQQRYMMTVRVADMTGETYATMFNDQVRHAAGQRT